MRIGITGVPGTGKTTLSKELSKILNYKYININDIVNEKELWVVIDPTDNAKVVNLRGLEEYLQNNLEENSVYDGHLLCEMQLPLDIIIVLRTPTKILGKRLEERNYNSAKIKANIYSEAMDYCTEKAIRKYDKSKVYEILTDKKIEENLKEIKQILKGEGKQFLAPWVTMDMIIKN